MAEQARNKSFANTTKSSIKNNNGVFGATILKPVPHSHVTSNQQLPLCDTTVGTFNNANGQTMFSGIDITVGNAINNDCGSSSYVVYKDSNLMSKRTSNYTTQDNPHSMFVQQHQHQQIDSLGGSFNPLTTPPRKDSAGDDEHKKTCESNTQLPNETNPVLQQHDISTEIIDLTKQEAKVFLQPNQRY